MRISFGLIASAVLLASHAGATSLLLDADQSTYGIGDTVTITLTGDVDPGATASTAFVRLELFGAAAGTYLLDVLHQSTASGQPEAATTVQAVAQFTYMGGAFSGSIDAATFDFFGLPPQDVLLGGNLSQFGIAPIFGTAMAGPQTQSLLGSGWVAEPLTFQVVVQPIPEPGTAGLLGLGLVGLARGRAARVRRR